MAIGLGFGAFAAGMVLLALTLAAAGLTGALVLRRLAPELAGPAAGLAWALLATSALLLAHAVPLALGILSRPAVIVAGLLLLGVAAVWARGERKRTPAPSASRPAVEADRPRGGWDLVTTAAAVAAALVAGGAALAYLRVQVAQPIISSDALNFQIPQVARWLQTGSLWQLDQFFPGYSNATYPHHGNLLILSVVLPFDSAFLVRLVAVPFAAVAALAVAAGARELGASWRWAVLAAALFAAIPTVGKVALDGAQTDAPMLAFAGAGGVFLLRHRRTAARADLALAALGFGLALGTKWYALTTLPVIGLVWVLARLLARTPGRRVAGDAALLAAGTLAAGGLWLVRNWVEAANPLFPQAFGPFAAPRDEIREQAGFTLAHYLGDGDVWSRYLRPTFDAFLAAPGYALLVAPAVVLAAIALWARRGAGAAAAVALAGVGLVVAYLVTPYSAFGPEGAPLLAFASVRYALPAALAGAVALAWLGSRLPAAAGTALAVAALAAVLAGVREQYRPAVSWPAIAAAAVVLGGLAAAVRARPRAAGGGAGRVTVAAAVVVVVAFGAAALVRDRGQGTGYGSTDPVLGWIAANAPSGQRIGLAGQWSVAGVSPVLPAFGPRLGNQVEYAGPFVAHLLTRETREAPFAARLRARRYDLVVVGLEGGAPELGWARAAGYVPVVSSQRLALLRRPG